MNHISHIQTHRPNPYDYGTTRNDTDDKEVKRKQSEGGKKSRHEGRCALSWRRYDETEQILRRLLSDQSPKSESYSFCVLRSAVVTVMRPGIVLNSVWKFLTQTGDEK